MEISSLTSSVSAQPKDRLNEMSSEEFLKVMFAELEQQDPMEPQDSGKLIEQLGQIRTLQSQVSLQSTLEDFAVQNQMASASNMLGKQIHGHNDANDAVSGVVNSIRVSDGKVYLGLSNGQAVNMSRVTEVEDAPDLALAG